MLGVPSILDLDPAGAWRVDDQLLHRDARPAETLPNEKAEISTKCATRTIAVVPLRSCGR